MAYSRHHANWAAKERGFRRQKLDEFFAGGLLHHPRQEPGGWRAAAPKLVSMRF